MGERETVREGGDEEGGDEEGEREGKRQDGSEGSRRRKMLVGA